ncbi:urease accessory protein [Roseibium hamelinense]|uniref:Urease accessory protein UreE n=1 Tax=Roseibium hamelinense TaxID=150831 RepID=A0A562SN87_9HYPH|nr:urease accessory protein UreE [Roseibium hamelinense]MTI44006.1 urease accessory protein UreE [Roseibium hamelinense]TWI82787.1 urease accessory protein [Roseibium hamelinense]
MIRVKAVKLAGTWTGKPIARVTLDREDRYRRRAVLSADNGTSFLLDEPTAVHLRHGDCLELEDGTFIEVVAKCEDLVDITAGDSAHLIKIAWHLGNRHLPTQLLGNTLRIRRDHVIESMVEQLGGRLVPVSAPFDPEGGAYGRGQTHGHGHHGHSHG